MATSFPLASLRQTLERLLCNRTADVVVNEMTHVCDIAASETERV
jgi:hypothetical protein